MGKESRARVLANNQAQAVARMIRISPRKLNLLAQSIRGKKAEVALNSLSFSEKRIANVVKKVLQSAIANAENNHDLDVDNLVIKSATVGKNLVMKRFHARARGRGAGIEKPFSQITIVVEEMKEEAIAEAKEKKIAAKKRNVKKPEPKKTVDAVKETA